jgi:hypothetical protein
MGSKYSTHESEEECIHGFDVKNWKTGRFQYLGVVQIVLRGVLKL